MQKYIRTDFGFKTIKIGNILIFTGKIRIRANAEFLRNKLQNYAEHLTITDRFKENKHTVNYYSTITFETTNALLSKQLFDAINNVLCEIMHDRIDAKYNRKMVYEPLDYLPY